MPMGKFLIYTIAGSTIWNTVLLVMGSVVGENWVNMLNIFDQYSHIVLIILMIVFVIGCIIFYNKKTNNFFFKRKKINQKDSSTD